MQKYRDFPPVHYFTRVLKHHPKSAYLYLLLWGKCEKKPLTIQKKDIRKMFLISPTLFRNLISPLVLMRLLTNVQTEKGFVISVTGTEADED